MRVLYVSKALTVGAYRDKLRALAAHVDIRAVVPARWGRQPVEPVDPDDPPVAFHDVLLDGYNHFHLYRSVQRILRAAGPDLVHIDEEPYSAVTAQLVFHCRRLAIPCCFFAAQNLDRSIPPPFGWLRSWVFRNVNGALAGTGAAARVLRQRGFTGRLAVIAQMGVDPERFRPCPRARQRVRDSVGLGAGFLVGYGGRLVPEKGLPLLMRAMAAQREDAHLLLIGDGPERAVLEGAARDAGLARRVHFAGTIRSTAMAEWLAALDVLVLPSIRRPGRMEQFGRILVEAMACGVPVIGSTCGEIPRVIGRAGIVVPEGDANALADAIRRLHDDGAACDRLGREGRQRVAEHFTNAAIAAATAGFYRDILEAA